VVRNSTAPPSVPKPVKFTRSISARITPAAPGAPAEIVPTSQSMKPALPIPIEFAIATTTASSGTSEITVK
jgi:hypothetical protein